MISRRTFLKTSTALAAASILGPAANAANERINVGIIGCRNRGPQVAESMMGTGLFNITTICDCDEMMLAKAIEENRQVFKHPPKQERDFRRLLEDPSIDAVVVAAPDHWHAMMTVMALDAGKHVYLEKPASYNIEDGKAMVAAQAKHAKQVIQVGTQQRSGKHFREAKEFIASGGLGKVAFCRASFITEREVVPVIPDTDPPPTLDYEMWIGPAAMRPFNENLVHYNWHFLYNTGTGDMGNWGAHWLDVIRWLLDLDLPISVSGYGGRFVVNDAKEWPDTQTVLYEFPALTVAWELRHWSRFMPGGGDGNCCEFDGDKGSLIVDRSGWAFYPREEKAKKEPHPRSDLEVPHAQNFADAIRGKAKLNAPIEEGHKSAVMCHLGNISAVLNRQVRFDPAGQVILGDDVAAKWSRREYRAPWRLEDYV